LDKFGLGLCLQWFCRYEGRGFRVFAAYLLEFAVVHFLEAGNHAGTFFGMDDSFAGYLVNVGTGYFDLFVSFFSFSGFDSGFGSFVEGSHG
jgi:hypothetical protein